MNKATIKQAFITSLPVMAGYIVLGIGFGILLSAKGYNFLWAILMSITMYAGSMQYVAVELLGNAASLLTAALMTITVNARHIFYGISMIKKYKELGWRKWYAIFGLTDETYSLMCVDRELPPDVDKKNYTFLVTLMNHCYWITGCTAGTLIGTAFDFNTAGVDFSMTALFVIIFVEQWEKAENHLPTLLGIGISLIFLMIFGADNFLIPTMLGISASLFIFRNKLERNNTDD